MMRIRLLVLSTLFAATAAAQEVEIQAVGFSSSHNLLGGPLVGVGLVKRLIRPDFSVIRLGIDGTAGWSDRVGVACSGLSPQDSPCPVEAIRDYKRLVMGSLGIEIPPIGRGVFSLRVSGDGRVGWGRVRTRGKTSGNELDAQKAFAGLSLGVSVRWRASTRWALQAGAAGGRMGPLFLQAAEDGYTPFEHAFTTRRYSLGGVWTPRH